METHRWVRSLKRFARNANEAMAVFFDLADILEKLLVRAAILAMVLREIYMLFQAL